MATGYIMLDTKRPDPQQGMYPRRGGHKPSGTCIVHTTEGNWQAGAASLVGLVLRRADYGCYHRACDWADIELLYPWEWETWQDSETNNWAVGIAACCKTSDWGKMPQDVEEGFYRNMARMGADFVAYMKSTHKIDVPLRRISGAEARARKPGFCAHGDSGVARSDPGANFDWARFFQYMKEILTPPAPTQIEDEKMLIIGKQIGQTAIWIGDGVVRRHIPNPEVLGDLQWAANNGFLKIHGNGKVHEWHRIDILGEEVGNREPFTNLYGTPMNVHSQLAHIDKNVNDHAAKILAAIESNEKATIDLTEEDMGVIADKLKEALTPSLANDLARRLAD